MFKTMTEEKLKEIEARWASNEVTMQTINDFNLLLSEVRRLNRMVDLSCKILGDVPGICLDEKGMRKFLESEVAE